MTHPSNPTTLRRRTVLGGVASLSLAGALGVSGCGKDAPTPAEEQQKAKEVLPTYKKLQPSQAPDLPGSDVVQDVYFSYPNPQQKSVDHELGKGGDVTAMVMSYTPPPTPLSKNSYWAEINKRLNINYKPDVVPASDYVQKFSTVIGGGGDLPNLIQLPMFMPLPRVQQLIDNRFLDLSEALGGDAISKYPNLANIPSYAWQWAIAKGKIWGVPVVRPLYPNVFRYRQDISAKAGFQEVPKTEEGFIEWAKAVTDKSQQRYAIGNSFGLAWALSETTSGMYEVPNTYGMDNGSLTQNTDHDGWWQGMELLKKLWGMGVIHPDTPSMTQPQMQAALFGGKCIASEDGAVSLADAAKYPDVSLRTRPTWTKDGKKVHCLKGTGIFSVLAIDKGQESRREELLNVLDYLAAPFGSEEYTLITFGLEGEHHSMKSGSPVPNQDKADDLGLALRYLTAAPGVLYAPDKQQQGIYGDLQATQKALSGGFVENPAAGLKSDTQEKSGSYGQAIADARNEYILGRKPLEAVKSAVAAYTKDVWPKVKKELEEKIAARS